MAVILTDSAPTDTELEALDTALETFMASLEEESREQMDYWLAGKEAFVKPKASEE